MDIDLSKAPKGATHYCNGLFYRLAGRAWLYCKPESNEWLISGKVLEWHDENLTLIHPQWSIHTNDKPLSELTDSQAAELFNHWRNGGGLEFFTTTKEWFNSPLKPRFAANRVYRAKRKSERELLVEYWLEQISGDDALDVVSTDDVKAVVVAMFNAGFEAPKGGE